MKFLCVDCDRQMTFEERALPGDGTLAATFKCPTCGRVVAMLTNPMETQLVASLGVEIGGRTVPAQPLETVRKMVTTGRDDAFEDGKTVVVLPGDAPLITAQALADLVNAHEAGAAAATMATMHLDDPAGYGRVVRDEHGNVLRVVETKADGDATPDELKITEVNSSIFAFDATMRGISPDRTFFGSVSTSIGTRHRPRNHSRIDRTDVDFPEPRLYASPLVAFSKSAT